MALYHINGFAKSTLHGGGGGGGGGGRDPLWITENKSLDFSQTFCHVTSLSIHTRLNLTLAPTIVSDHYPRQGSIKFMTVCLFARLCKYYWSGSS